MPKILIVDDDTEHTKIIEDLLAKCNIPYEITCVSNGLECLELLDKLSINKEALPNLIILDIVMPVMDGKHFIIYVITQHIQEYQCYFFQLVKIFLLKNMKNSLVQIS